ncbi:unnamed protein product [Schistocephalus solidus]|uniref:C2H2-type domain-containing protein n=1 Tax=Schistocephalus solidus TaxID=70667 RepID=A0A183TGP6_SCHSO|nr:unnamed protein product [Schistocephalus solidus]
MEQPPGEIGGRAATQTNFTRRCHFGCWLKGRTKRRYKDTLKKYLKQLQINPATWEDLAWYRLAWRRSVKTGAAIYEAKRIAKRAAHKSQSPRIHTANAQALPTYPRCPCTFRERIGLVEHFRTKCNNNPATSNCFTCLRPHENDHPNH